MKRILISLYFFYSVAAIGQGLPYANGVGISTGNIITQNLNPLTGTPTTGSFVRLKLANQATASVSVSGTYTGVLSMQYTTDNGTTWITITNPNQFVSLTTATPSAAIASASVGTWTISTGSAADIRITALAAITGTAIVSIKAISAALQVGINQPLPAGANVMGGVTQSGTWSIGTVTTLANGQTAHSSASTGSPLRVSGRVVPTTAATQDQTLAAGDAADIPLTTGQQLVIKAFSSAENDWQFASAASGIVNTTTAVTIKAASGTVGVRNYITGISIQSEALGTSTELAIRDGAAGTVIWRTKLPINAQPLVNIVFPTPLKGTANTLLEVVTLTATTGAVYFNAQGYIGF
jgi:hypothetical protein